MSATAPATAAASKPGTIEDRTVSLVVLLELKLSANDKGSFYVDMKLVG